MTAGQAPTSGPGRRRAWLSGLSRHTYTYHLHEKVPTLTFLRVIAIMPVKKVK
jgi:hypothetical protein